MDGQSNFVIGLDFYEVYPKGCFKSFGDNPLWFNPFGDIPRKPYLGTPICHRHKYQHGTTGTNAGGCDEDYQKILTQEECRSFAACSSHCTSTQFTVGEEVEHNAGWYVGEEDEDCSSTCVARTGLVCNAASLEKMKEIGSQAAMTAILGKETCSGGYADTDGAEAPFKIIDAKTNQCNFVRANSEPSCMAMTPTGGKHYKRFCYCSFANDARPADTGPDFYDKRPQGCFIHPTDKCVYYNVPRNTTPSGTIEGTPVCQAKHGQTVHKKPEATVAATTKTAAKSFI